MVCKFYIMIFIIKICDKIFKPRNIFLILEYEKCKILDCLAEIYHIHFQKIFYSKFKELNLPNYSYEIFDIDNINEIKRIIKDGDLLGLNVTIPYKEQVLPFLDIVSAEGESIGAVNTILIKNGQLKGFNTDVLWI